MHSQTAWAAVCVALLLGGSGESRAVEDRPAQQTLLEGRVTVADGPEFGGRRPVVWVTVWPAPTVSWFDSVLDSELPPQPLARATVDPTTDSYSLELPAGRRYRLVAQGRGLAPREIVWVADRTPARMPEVRLGAGSTCRLRIATQSTAVASAVAHGSLRVAVWSSEDGDEGGWRPATQLLDVNRGNNRRVRMEPFEHAYAVGTESDVVRDPARVVLDGACRLVQGSLPAVDSVVRVGASAGVDEANIRVRVEDAKARASSGALVWLTRLAKTPTSSWTVSRPSAYSGVEDLDRHLVPEVTRVGEGGVVFLNPGEADEESSPIPGSEWVLHAWAPGHLPARLVLTGAPAVHVRLVRASELAGRVMFGSQPVEGATVTVADPPRESVAGALPASATLTDRSGFYRLGALRANRHLRVEAVKEGLGSDTAGVMTVSFESGPGRRDFLLAPTLTIRGRVVTPGGEAIAGAELAVPTSSVHNGPPSRWPATGSGWRPRGGIVRSDANGNFVLELPPVWARRDQSLVVAASGWAVRTLRVPAPERADQVVDLEDVVMAPAARIEGLVVDASGRPIRGASVGYARAGVEAPMLRSAAMVNAAEANVVDGRFVVDGLLVEDAVNLRASAAGFLPRLVFSVRPGEPWVEIELSRSSGIVISIEDELGRTAQCTVVVLKPSGARGGRGTVKHPCIQGGEQRVEGLNAGPYVLTVASHEHELYREQVIVPPAGQEGLIRVRLHALQAEVVGSVLSDAGPVAGARVAIGGGAIISDAAGRFEVTVRTGRQVVEIEHPWTGAATRHPREFVRGLNEVDFDVSERWLTGWVRDSEGMPVSGAFLALRSQELFGTFDATTAEDGSFEVSAVPGRYSVTIVARAGELEEQVDLLERSTTGRIFRFDRTGRLEFVVAGLRADEEAKVSYSRSPLEPGGGGLRYTARDSNVAVDGLPFGRWFVSATTVRTGRRGYATVELTPQRSEALVEIALGEHKVNGVVRLDGREAPGVAVFLVAADESGGVRSMSSGAGGYFEFSGVESGSHYLSTDTVVMEVRVPSNGPTVLEVESGTATIDVRDADTELAIPDLTLEIWPARVGWDTARRLGALRRYVSSTEPVSTGSIPIGAYRVRVSGAGIAPAESLMQVSDPGRPTAIEVRRE